MTQYEDFEGFAQEVREENLDEYSSRLKPISEPDDGSSDDPEDEAEASDDQDDTNDQKAPNPFQTGESVKVDIPFKRSAPSGSRPDGQEPEGAAEAAAADIEEGEEAPAAGPGAAPPSSPATDGPGRAPSQLESKTLVIQIIPHHNGEVFLSKTAVVQDKDFFGFPFQGKTTPKKPSNPSYPQRLPDPVVHLTVYGAGGSVLAEIEEWDLNTVYYEPKSEIRITIPPELAREIPEYSILVMSETDDPDLDYIMDVHTTTSPLHGIFLRNCDQTMPSGGKMVARQFGWLED